MERKLKGFLFAIASFIGMIVIARITHMPMLIGLIISLAIAVVTLLATTTQKEKTPTEKKKNGAEEKTKTEEEAKEKKETQKPEEKKEEEKKERSWSITGLVGSIIGLAWLGAILYILCPQQIQMMLRMDSRPFLMLALIGLALIGVATFKKKGLSWGLGVLMILPIMWILVGGQFYISRENKYKAEIEHKEWAEWAISNSTTILAANDEDGVTIDKFKPGKYKIKAICRHGSNSELEGWSFGWFRKKLPFHGYKGYNTNYTATDSIYPSAPIGSLIFSLDRKKWQALQDLPAIEQDWYLLEIHTETKIFASMNDVVVCSDGEKGFLNNEGLAYIFAEPYNKGG